MGDRRDPPIEELGYLAGVKVVNIGDVRVARGMTRRPASACKHLSLRYDTHERRIWCSDCEQTIEGYDAFVILTEMFSAAKENHDKRERIIAEAEAHSVRSIAAKVIDEAWRSRRMVPACPHCRAPLLPEDFKNGIGLKYGREYAEAMVRKRHAEPKP